MKIYVTKWALTLGILEMEAEDDVDGKRLDMAYVPGVLLISTSQNFHKREWHRTRAEAITRAEEMRQNKMRSLQKQLMKLSTMVIPCPE